MTQIATTLDLSYDCANPYDDARIYDGFRDADPSLNGVWSGTSGTNQAAWTNAEKIDKSGWNETGKPQSNWNQVQTMFEPEKID